MTEELKLSSDEIGNLIGLSGRRVRQMSDEGLIPRPVAGKFDAGQVVRRLIANASDARPDPERTARAALITAKTRSATIKNEREVGNLIRREEAEASMDFLAGKINEELSGLPARLTRDRLLRIMIDDEVQAIRKRLASALAIAAGVIEDDVADDDDVGAAS